VREVHEETATAVSLQLGCTLGNIIIGRAS